MDPAAGGEEEDQAGLQAGSAPLSVQPHPQQPHLPQQHLLQRRQVEQYVVHCEYTTAPKRFFPPLSTITLVCRSKFRCGCWFLISAGSEELRDLFVFFVNGR